jgi:hypothetical protein
MEPTGIEPVTSCLQSGTPDPPGGLDSLGFSGDPACSPLADTAGLGSIRLGLGSGIGLLPKRLTIALEVHRKWFAARNQLGPLRLCFGLSKHKGDTDGAISARSKIAPL